MSVSAIVSNDSTQYFILFAHQFALLRDCPQHYGGIAFFSASIQGSRLNCFVLIPYVIELQAYNLLIVHWFVTQATKKVKKTFFVLCYLWKLSFLL